MHKSRNRRWDGVRISFVKRFNPREDWNGLSQYEKRQVFALCAEAVELIVRSRRVMALAARAAMRQQRNRGNLDRAG
jgi:hypothetical protein